MNSDDLYLPGAIGRAVEALSQNPIYVVVYSDAIWINDTGEFLSLQQSGPLDVEGLLAARRFGIPQPTAFMRREVVERVEGLDEPLHLSMDLDFWVKLAFCYRLGYLEGQPLAMVQQYALNKTYARMFESLKNSLGCWNAACKIPGVLLA